MADSKITALTAISTVDPTADPLVIVDVSDTSMAASGTTKKSTINQLLGAGGTATLASATITGDLTVDTSTLKVDSATNNVSIGGLVHKVTGVSVSGTGLTIQAPAVPTLGIWDTTDPSYFTNLAQIDANFYFYNNASGALVFGVGNNESMRLNSTGLGVGVTPSALLHVQKSQNSETTAIINNTNTGTSAGVRLDLQSNSSNYLTLQSFGQNYSGNAFGIAAAKLNVVSENSATAFSSGLAIGTTSSNPLYFATSNAVKMTLTAAGDLLVGKTATNSGTVGVEIQPNGNVWATKSASTSAATAWDTYSTGAGAYRFYVGMDGTVNATNTTISAISDARLKENVQDIDVGLGAILALKPRKFDWKAGKGKDIKGDRGFIAQEFEQVFPQLVDEWKDPAPEGETPYKSVRQDLIPVLVKAIQELAVEVNALKNA